VWVIGPAGDNVAAPPRPNAKPLVAQGRVLDEVEQGNDFVLRTVQGTRYILRSAMFFGAEVDVLRQLAKDNAPVLARGYADTNPRGETNFEPSRCVFLYRLP
jgi:hypothetical protein